MKKSKNALFLALVTCTTLLCQMPVNVHAEEKVVELTSFVALVDKNVSAGTEQDKIGLPTEMTATYLNGGTSTDIQVPIQSWTPRTAYTPNVPGNYIFDPVLSTGFSKAVGVTLPSQKVIVDAATVTSYSSVNVQGYNPIDVAVINDIISNNGLKGYALNDPQHWNFITWIGDQSSKTIFTIDLTQKGLTGKLDLSKLTTLDTLKVGDNALTSIGKLPDSLLSLTCNDNQITNLLPLPPNINFLTCYKNKLSGVMDLSGYSQLTNLDCGNNQITSLGPQLPANLFSLYCYNNLITDLGPLPKFITDVHCQSNKLTGMLDISALSGLVAFDCSYNQITGLGTLSSQLSYLDCSNNLITNLGPLPKVLTTFNCANNKLTNLGSLPTGITELRCEYNELTGTLDVSRLSHLTMLLCSVNKLTSLGSLPTGITELRCEYNELTGTLDVSRLSRLTMLLCNVNKLTSLGTLPSNLNFLDCSDNQISRFDNLPRSMTRLFFGRNKISGVFDLSLLPALIDMGCDNNRITKFSGSLPNSLIALQCSENLLTSLPEIPNAMISLDCTGNKLTKLPKLPSGLEGLFCANNKITSLNLKGLTGLEILLFANNPLKTFISPDGFTCTLTSGRGGQIMSGIAMNKSGEINQYGDSYNLLTKEFTIRAQANSSYRRGMWRTGRSRIAYIGGTSASSESITFKLDRNVTISMNFNRKSPQTDDNNDMALYIGLLMTGLVGMISIAYIQKCKKRSKRNGK